MEFTPFLTDKFGGKFDCLFTHFRCQDVNQRKEYVTLVENVRDAGGEVKIFSSMHISGQRKHSPTLVDISSLKNYNSFFVS